MNRLRFRPIVGSIVLAAVMLLGSPVVAAHTELSVASPAPGSTVESLDEIIIDFRGELAEQATHRISLSTAEGIEIEAHSAELISSTRIRVEVDQPESGDYLVKYEVVAADEGLEQSSAYIFTLEARETPAVSIAGIVAAVSLAAIAGFGVWWMKRRSA